MYSNNFPRPPKRTRPTWIYNDDDELMRALMAPVPPATQAKWDAEDAAREEARKEADEARAAQQEKDDAEREEQSRQNREKIAMIGVRIAEQNKRIAQADMLTHALGRAMHQLPPIPPRYEHLSWYTRVDEVHFCDGVPFDPEHLPKGGMPMVAMGEGNRWRPCMVRLGEEREDIVYADGYRPWTVHLDFVQERVQPPAHQPPPPPVPPRDRVGQTPSGLPSSYDTALKQGGYGVGILMIMLTIGGLIWTQIGSQNMPGAFGATLSLIILFIGGSLTFFAFKYPRTAAVIGAAGGAYTVASNVHHHHQQVQADRIGESVAKHLGN